MNTRNKTATKFYTSEHADSSVQIGLAGREVAPESVMSKGNATHHLSSLDVSQGSRTTDREQDPTLILRTLKAGPLRKNAKTIEQVQALVKAATGIFVHEVNWNGGVTETDFWDWFHRMWPKITIEVSCGQGGFINEVRFFVSGQRKHFASARLVFHDLKKAAFKQEVKSEINRLLTVILDDEDFLQDDKMRAIGSRFDRMYDRANLCAFDTEERKTQRLAAQAVALGILGLLNCGKSTANPKAKKWAALLY
ncbi:hypothetical protein [Photobacterium damselae]|uniref:hypothetical protein n=1 Tax=Photobacterium damselae TaxID=38293 RepID=UPI0030F47675